MSRGTAWFVHTSALAVGATGLIYGWMRYVSEPEDEFALVNHPLEPDVKTLHILAAPLLVFACGVLWRAHVWARIRAGFVPRRWTGVLLAALLLPMIASGYLVQVAVDETWRSVWMWIHGVTGVLWVLAYGVHQLTSSAELE